MAALSLCCYSGDDTGLLKRVRLSPPAGTLQRWGEQARGGGVACACWGPTPLGEAYVGAGVDSGTVRFWRTDDHVRSRASLVLSSERAVGPAAVHVVGEVASSARVVACQRDGGVDVWQWAPAEDAEDEEAGTKEAEQHSGAAHDAAAGVPQTAFETGHGDVAAAAFDAAGARVALGGRDRDLSVWDVEAASVAFRARNVAHDNLDLPVPVWVSGLRFIPEQPRLIAMGTGFVQSRLRGEVRLYDVAAQRRPTMRKVAPLGDEAVRSIACTADGRYVLAASTAGTFARLDVRMSLKPLQAYKGAGGAIRDIALHPTLPLVASASLDRHVRLYHLRTGALVQKVYLKQRLSALLLSADTPATPATAAGEAPGGAAEGDDENVASMLGALPSAADDGVAAGDGGSVEASDWLGGRAFDDDEDDDDDDDDDGDDELDGDGGRGREEEEEEEDDDDDDEEGDEDDDEGEEDDDENSDGGSSSGGDHDDEEEDGSESDEVPTAAAAPRARVKSTSASMGASVATAGRAMPAVGRKRKSAASEAGQVILTRPDAARGSRGPKKLSRRAH